MFDRTHLVMAAFWLMSLAGVWLWMSPRPGAQALRAQEVLTLQQPTVYGGTDVGFRAYRTYGDRLVGRIVVRVNDQWYETDIWPLPQ